MWSDIGLEYHIVLFLVAIELPSREQLGQFTEFLIQDNLYIRIVLFERMNDKGVVIVDKQAHQGGAVGIDVEILH